MRRGITGGRDHRSRRFRRDSPEGRVFPHGFRENLGKGVGSSLRVGNQVFDQGRGDHGTPQGPRASTRRLEALAEDWSLAEIASVTSTKTGVTERRWAQPRFEQFARGFLPSPLESAAFRSPLVQRPSPGLFEGADFHAERPGTSRLVHYVPDFFSDVGGLNEEVVRIVGTLGSGPFHIDRSVDYEIGHVHALWSELARHGFGKNALCRFGRCETSPPTPSSFL